MAVQRGFGRVPVLGTEEMVRADVFSGRKPAYHADAPSLVFADYLQESWWYGIWLSGERRG